MEKFLSFLTPLSAVMVVLAFFGITILGLYLAFSVSIILGLLLCLLEPGPFIVGAVYILYNINIIERLANYLGL